MYTREQIQDATKQEREQRKQYDENSIANARTKWQDAREHVQTLNQETHKDHNALYYAREAESDAKKELDDALRYSAHLVEAKRLKDYEATIDADKRRLQQEQAAQEKSAYRAELKTRWLASGGSEYSFNERFEEMWTEEVRRRVTGYQSQVEQAAARLRSTGAYGGLA